MDILFWLVGAMAVAFGLVSVTRRNPIYAAFFLLMSMGCLAIEFLLLHAPFLAAMQVILYAGAIVVLFVFVIMLLSLKEGEMGPEPDKTTKAFAAVVATLTFLLLIAPVYRSSSRITGATADGKLNPVPKVYSPKIIYKVVATRSGVRLNDLRVDTKNEQAKLEKWSQAKRKRVQSARRQAAYFVAKTVPQKSVDAAPVLGFKDAKALRNVAKEVAALVESGEQPQLDSKASKDPALATTMIAMQRSIDIRAARYGSVEDIVSFLYSRYMVAFELVSILILAAVAGVIVLARRRGFMGMEVDGEKQKGGMFL